MYPYVVNDKKKNKKNKIKWASFFFYRTYGAKSGGKKGKDGLVS